MKSVDQSLLQIFVAGNMSLFEVSLSVMLGH